MRNLVVRTLLVLFVSATGFAQVPAERTVLRKVIQIYQTQGQVTFSSLYNSDEFTPQEKAFLGRLYEIFFAIPAVLKSDFEVTGQPPSRARLAEHFGVSPLKSCSFHNFIN